MSVRRQREREQKGARRWCFTINQPRDGFKWESDKVEETEWNRVWTLLCPIAQPSENETPIRYAVFQLEKGEAEGKIHIQGYCECSTTVTLSQMKRILENRTVHLEIARGTGEQNREYCTKEDTRYDPNCIAEFGELGYQGKRTDIETFASFIKSGKSDMECIDAFPAESAKYTRYIDFVRSAKLRYDINNPNNNHHNN